ncbi:MAG TPA: protein-S-isoprenylcysteine O-methyltransferase [Herpetosiphonaceae bacterium]
MGERIYLLGMVTTLGMRIWQRWRARHRVVVRSHVSWREYLVLGLGFVGIMVIPLLHVATDMFAGSAYHLPPWASWLGAGLFGGALWLVWRAHADLGRNWSQTLEVRQDHQLVTVGVYRHLRHPMYAGFVLWGLAQPLLLQNAIAGWTHLAAMLLLCLVRIPQEEAMMEATFGVAYTTYMRQTGRLIPRLVRHRQ